MIVSGYSVRFLVYAYFGCILCALIAVLTYTIVNDPAGAFVIPLSRFWRPFYMLLGFLTSITCLLGLPMYGMRNSYFYDAESDYWIPKTYKTQIHARVELGDDHHD
jgi:H+/Cl- antiporter ClcA